MRIAAWGKRQGPEIPVVTIRTDESAVVSPRTFCSQHFLGAVLLLCWKLYLMDKLLSVSCCAVHSYRWLENTFNTAQLLQTEVYVYA